jgi:hypothetical protein
MLLFSSLMNLRRRRVKCSSPLRRTQETRHSRISKHFQNASPEQDKGDVGQQDASPMSSRKNMAIGTPLPSPPLKHNNAQKMRD